MSEIIEVPVNQFPFSFYPLRLTE